MARANDGTLVARSAGNEQDAGARRAEPQFVHDSSRAMMHWTRWQTRKPTVNQRTMG